MSTIGARVEELNGKILADVVLVRIDEQSPAGSFSYDPDISPDLYKWLREARFARGPSIDESRLRLALSDGRSGLIHITRRVGPDVVGFILCDSLE